MSYSYPHLAPSALPATYAHEDRPHRCGKCSNPYTYGNPNCVNANPTWNLGRTPRHE